MEESKIRGDELDEVDLAAFDLLLAQLKEKGKSTVSSHDFLFATPAITFVVREAVKWAVKFAARTAICLAPVERVGDDARLGEKVANIPDEISLNDLVKLREKLGKY